MARPRLRRNLPSLHTEERAIVTSNAGSTTDLKCYGIALSLSSAALHLLTDEAVPMGELLDVSISLQGQDQSHNLKGVARTISACDHQPGYVVGIDIVPDNQAARWRHQFH
jgi:hypothetical protein